MNPIKILQKYFGYKSFRNNQENIINEIISGKDAICVMPTGAGKSICYQIPAIIFDGITIVISPLISLMKDQVDMLNENGVSSAYINSSLSTLEYNNIIENIKNDKYKLIYMAPERLQLDGFYSFIKNKNISMIAIDEAHCISQWGHEFRPSYRNIANLINNLDNRPIVTAFTATATPIVKEDIENQLNLKNPFRLTTSFNRENIYFEVIETNNKLSYLKDNLNENSSSIIYCSTRKNVEEVYDFLKANNLSVTRYHAGLSDDERFNNQNDFIYDKKSIMVATVAFGMGIDKSDVREVIHYNLPKTMENYYQEAGRCGRDGEKAKATLLYSAKDIQIQNFLIRSSTNSEDDYKKLDYMIDYANTNNCLRNTILNYFNEYPEKNCNDCSNCNTNFLEKDITIEAQKILSCIKRMGEKSGANLVIDVLKGSRKKQVLDFNYNNLSTYNLMKEYKRDSLQEIIQELIRQDALFSTGMPKPILKLNEKSYDIFKGKAISMKYKEEDKKDVYNLSTDIKSEEQILFNILKSWRYKKSKEHSIPPYIIATDKLLEKIIHKKPLTIKSLRKIEGISEKKSKDYGQDIIKIIEDYLAKHPKEKKSKDIKISDTKLESYKLYQEKISFDNISEIRNLSKNTIINHILDCFYLGYPVREEDFLKDEWKDYIIQAVENVGDEYLKPIKDLIPDEISYEAIKYTLISMKKEKISN